MSLSFDFYFSFRSPYSYLAAPQIEALVKQYDVAPRMRIVMPIAIRIPGFFKQVNPLWPPYLLRDTFRISQMNGIPYRWPRPDPIVMDHSKNEVAAEQPYIYRVSRLGVAAARLGKGLEFVRAASHAIWSGEVDDWHEGDHLTKALAQAGLDPAEGERMAAEDAEGIDAEIAANEAAQRNAGHWGVPLFVFNDEPFFGQDRIDHLIWRMKQAGLAER
ncbi:MAG TPA: 2-hydroxychromene-2-carboxylate isomerase [Terricaulis sp.]|nr:2-hydroxychromene-2-carboxylate isomerase [Terricaulis sp.]HRP10029.1 2-hydroxychromene-2-carboxylate isomerase [Terricaulis sp.]